MNVSEKVFNDVYKDGLAELVAYYAGLDKIFEYLGRFASIRSVTVGLYNVLVGMKEIKSIKDLEEKEKWALWKQTDKSLKIEERKDQARAIYLINLIKCK